MFFTLTAFAFGVAALIFFFLAFRAVTAGKMGAAAGLAVLALIMSGVAGATAAAI